MKRYSILDNNVNLFFSVRHIPSFNSFITVEKLNLQHKITNVTEFILSGTGRDPVSNLL